VLAVHASPPVELHTYSMQLLSPSVPAQVAEPAQQPPPGALAVTLPPWMQQTLPLTH
jgi:hypothetical protein